MGVDIIADIRLDQVESFAEALKRFSLSFISMLISSWSACTSVVLGESVTCPVVCSEDVILAKLKWFRLGGEISDRQWRDIAGVFAVNADLDIEYLRVWAGRLRVDDLLVK